MINWKQALRQTRESDPITDVVYLDQDYRSFKYFITGRFDKSTETKENETSGFLLKLDQLNDKITLFKEQFLQKDYRKIGQTISRQSNIKKKEEKSTTNS